VSFSESKVQSLTGEELLLRCGTYKIPEYIRKLTVTKMTENSMNTFIDNLVLITKCGEKNAAGNNASTGVFGICELSLLLFVCFRV
jgi:hypothetical protein